MKRFNQFFKGIHERESRLLHIEGGLDNVPAIGAGDATEMKEFKDWKLKTPGVQTLFDACAEVNPVELATLDEYISWREANAGLQPFDQDVKRTIDTIRTSKNPADALAAEKKIQRLIDAINNRNLVMNDAQSKRGEFQQKEELPIVTGGVVDLAKSAIGASIDGVKNATAAERVLMIGGVISGVLMLRYAMSKLPKGSFIKGSLGLVATIIGFEALNKTVEKVRGAPLVSWKNGYWPEFPMGNLMPFSDNEGETKKQMINDAYAELKDLNVTSEFLDQIGMKGQERDYAIGINNMSNMSVAEFGSAYEQCRGSHQVPNDSPLFAGSEGEDQLTPSERYFLLYDIGQTLGLIDGNGDFTPPPQPDRANKTLLYLMIDWDPSKSKVPTPKKEDPPTPDFNLPPTI